MMILKKIKIPGIENINFNDKSFESISEKDDKPIKSISEKDIESEVSDNLDDFPFESDGNGKYGKYIRWNGDKFFIFKSIKGTGKIFGYFDSHDEAILARDKLIETNWGLPKDENVNIYVPEGKYGRYIIKNNEGFWISKLLHGNNVYHGKYESLENAEKARDILIETDWDFNAIPENLYVVPSKTNYIHRRRDKYIISKVIDGEIKYFGTYDSYEEARYHKNILLRNGWKIEDDTPVEDEEEEYDINVYVKNDVYYVKNKINGQLELFGTFYDSIEAINFRNDCIRNNWNVKKVFNVPLEIETPKSLKFPVTIGLSSKNKGWAVLREFIDELVPIQKCEGEIPIEFEGISTSSTFKILVRLFYNKNDELANYLENQFSINGESLVNVELFLDQENSDMQETFNFHEKKDFLEVTKEFTKSFSETGQFTIPREFSIELFDKLPYESSCNFEVDGIRAKGRLNLLLRSKLNKNDLDYLNSIKNIGDTITFKIPILK